MAPLPPIAPYPAIAVRNKLPPPDWSAALATYNAILTHRLSLPPSSLLSDSALHVFIRSYFHELSHAPPSPPPPPPTLESRQLKQSTFRLLSRILTSPAGAKLPHDLITGQFLLSLAVSLPKSTAVRNTLDTLWANHHGSVEESISSFKSTIVLSQLLLSGGHSPSPAETLSLLRSLSILFLVSPRIGELFIAGSDFLDALINLYAAQPALRKSILRITHAAFTSLLPPAKLTVNSTPRKPNYSLFLDHLYSLQSHQPGSKEHTFLSALTSTTTFLDRLHSTALLAPNARFTSLISILEDKYKTPRSQKKPTAADKGKGKSTNDESTIPNDLLVRYTLQVLEVFPELSSSWVRATLTKLNGDVEALIRGYLDGTICNENPTPTSPQIHHHHHQRISSLQPPRPPIFPVRKNIHDNDDLDMLSESALRSLHIGKRDSPTEVAGPDSATKAAIWAALAAFDGDDDERDDTYDVADVGGAVDTTNTEPDPAAPLQPPPPTTFAASAQQDIPNPEKILYTLWTTSNPSERAVYFARDSATRRSTARGDLKRKTGWSDEAIEGWGVMLERDVAGRRMRELERRFGEGGLAGGEEGGGEVAGMGEVVQVGVMVQVGVGQQIPQGIERGRKQTRVVGRIILGGRGMQGRWLGGWVGPCSIKALG
ncbi:hypothetical protein L211DRAFT_433037 [Terfezia boudieri ATCC MYA-4762]|uniref:CUE domain-containing protein n=1 Tax=Terfezia boudieri ATCC MYA-4762 TaxID=1051890 RepID=A0A3N4LL85_9PEZI|nr:hypothetical protein L211DRAFT_433037 [Terfezia boudieri ATCC MYA-4762]